MKKLLSFFIAATLAINLAAQQTGTFTDKRDSKTYKTVKIGNQTWMAENLAYYNTDGCWAYENNNSNLAKYGYLYNWETAKNVCPAGWHLPTKEEFEAFLTSIGGSGPQSYSALIASGSSGFSVTFGGCRGGNGEFNLLNTFTLFWSSTVFNTEDACNLGMGSSKEGAIIGTIYKDAGLSVRCIRDK
jgi:uncharacterized protein (TIGR02145 family)